MTRLRVTVDVREIEGLAKSLARVDGRLFSQTATDVVNEVARRAYDTIVPAMNAGINLTDAYVRSKTDLVLATGGSAPEAAIVGRGDLTILGHYDPVVTHRAAAGPAKGDPSRDIPPGRRAAGVSVEVRRGGRKTIDRAFTMRLRRGTRDGDQVGVFLRTAGVARHLYALAPYSLFRKQATERVDDIAADLESTAADRFIEAVGRAL